MKRRRQNHTVPSDNSPLQAVLLVLCSDLSFAFFRTLSRQTVNSETVKPTGRTPMAPSPQQHMVVWCAGSRVVYTCGLQSTITMWRVAPLDKDGYHSIAKIGELRRHTDVVKDICCIEPDDGLGGAPGGGGEAADNAAASAAGSSDSAPGDEPSAMVDTASNRYLASASLDASIQLWDLRTGEWLAELQAHRAGVRALAYDRLQSILFSAGFEFDVRAWALIGSQAYPLFTLVGHAAPIKSLACAPGASRLASLDETGKFIWWDTRRDAALDANERAVDSFKLEGDAAHALGVCAGCMPGFTVPNARAYSENDVAIFAAGKRLHVLDAVDTRPPEPPPVAAVYTAASCTIVTAHGRAAKTWDALSGLLVRELEDLTASDITALDFDSRGRRLIAAEQARRAGRGVARRSCCGFARLTRRRFGFVLRAAVVLCVCTPDTPASGRRRGPRRSNNNCKYAPV